MSDIKQFQSRQFTNIYASAAAFLICSSAFVFYIILAMNHPVVYWGDAHVRLALHNQILLGHWLPLLQILILIISKISSNLLVMRGFLAFIATGALVGMYYFARQVFTPAIGLVAMTLLSVNMIFVAIAIVPYAEILFAGLILLALSLLERSASPTHFILGVIALNLASLTRYEGWLLALVLILELTIRSVKSNEWSSLVRVMILYSMVPLGWLIFIGFRPGSLGNEVGHVIEYVSSTPGGGSETAGLGFLNLDYVKSFTQNYLQLLARQTGSIVIALGIFGWSIALLDPKRRFLSLRILAFSILVFIMWLLWFSVNVWEPQNFALRTAFIGVLFFVFYASYGLERLIRAIFQQLSTLVQKPDTLHFQSIILFSVTLILSYFSILAAIKFVSQSSLIPDFYAPAQVGAWLNTHLSQQDIIVWVLSDDPLQPYALATYIHLPFDAILDDRLNDQQISSRLVNAQLIYVVESYRTRDGLSTKETNLLRALEDGTINMQSFTVDSTRIWLIPKSEINILRAIY
jgi:hypothetical protein